MKPSKAGQLGSLPFMTGRSCVDAIRTRWYRYRQNFKLTLSLDTVSIMDCLFFIAVWNSKSNEFIKHHICSASGRAGN